MQDKKVFIASQLQYYINELGYKISDIWLEEILHYMDPKLVNQIETDYRLKELSLTPESFIFYSESIFNEKERKEKGIAYTPELVANKIIEFSISQLKEDNLETFKVLDPAVGGGIFLVLTARILSKKHGIPIDNIIEQNLFGVDIVPENIMLTRVALILLALEQNCKLPTNFNLMECDSFKLNTEKGPSFCKGGNFDLVITNPPYIRSKNLTYSTKKYLKDNFKTVHGILDSYIPFFEVAISLLAPGKVATLITPNTFLTSLNGSELRKYLLEEGEKIKLINFSNQKLFDGISSYSAITSIVKKDHNSKECSVHYLVDSFFDSEFLNSKNQKWQSVKQQQTWRTLNSRELNIINKLESAFATQLKDLKFKNGIATQRNNLYSFIVEYESKEFYHFTLKGTPYKVEKDITRPFIKPNEKEQNQGQKIIFPYQYNVGNQKNEVIPEEIMRRKYPFAYNYLLEQKKELDKRASDKGIPTWYAYGRSQGLNDFGNRMYLPYIAKRVFPIVSDNTVEVFAAGYAIFDEDLNYLKSLSDILTSSIFSFYIAMVSKPYSGGYYSTAKNLVRFFSIPSKEEFSKYPKGPVSDEFIFEMYGLTPQEREQVFLTLKSL